MRWIDRGLEPDAVEYYARRFTQGWVRYFQNRVGARPTDSHWRGFRSSLGVRSGNVCWYCERPCQTNTEDTGKAPTLDHFRPLRHFPELAYEWRNWVFSCLRCNGGYKQDNWPLSGYVDPSAVDEQERPEYHFDYDPDTGEIIPRAGLESQARNRALQTIDDLRLNKLDVRRFRLDWTRQFIDTWLSLPLDDRSAFVEVATQPGYEFAGASLMAIRQLSTSLCHK